MAYKPDEVFTKDEWDAITKKDPTFTQFQSASQWQTGTAVAQTYFADDPLAEILGSAAKDGKGKSQNWRELQKKCWELYRTFANISAATNSKADYTAGYGFSVYSTNLEIRRYLKDLVYSYRNRLYTTLIGWTIRMLAEGELFLLLVFDDEGRATIRTLEPERIGKGTRDDGLITNPDDVTQTLFYKHYYDKQDFEFIPDISIAFNPDLIKAAKQVEKFDIKATARSKAKGGKFNGVGGFRRFAIQWKNLTGILEYRRDLSVISTVLEAIHLYWNAIKWQLDHKKAQCAYTNVIGFEDSPQGRIAYSIWTSLSDEEKQKTGLTDSLTPGSTIILIPGMNFEVKAPLLSRLEGENRDLLNVAGAGMKSPQDLFQGQSAGSTYASLKASRSPLEMEIKNTQYKEHNFLKYELFRACFYISAQVSSKIIKTEYEKEEIEEFMEGQPKFISTKVEPAELIELTFPEISFEAEMEGKANAYLGSKHAGLRSIGISDRRIAKELGIGDLDRQIADKAREEHTYGARESKIDEGKKSSEPGGDKKGAGE